MTNTSQAELARFSSLIDLIYQGTTDLSAWQKVPAAVTEWMDAYSNLLFTPFHNADNGGFAVTHNLSPQNLELWSTKFYEHDIWVQRAGERGLVITGNVVRDQELVTEEEFLASRMWRDFLEPIGIGRVISGIVFSPADQGTYPVICTCHRPFERPFSEQDAGKLALVIPHISRSLGVMFKLRDSEFKVATSLAAMDHLPNGVLLVNADGEVTYANKAAHRILEQEDGLFLKASVGRKDVARLMVSDAATQYSLDTAIQEAVSPEFSSTLHFSRALAIPRPSGLTPYSVNFSSLPTVNEFGLGSDTPRAIIFLTDNAAPAKLNSGLLKATYGLTPAEITTSTLIVEGASVEEIAEELNLSIDAIKTRIKSIYAKTNTNNRAKLVKLLMLLSH